MQTNASSVSLSLERTVAEIIGWVAKWTPVESSPGPVVSEACDFPEMNATSDFPALT